MLAFVCVVAVISVMMSVENEFEFAGIKIFERGFDLFGQRRELVVDDEYAIVTHGHADVPARAFQHVNVFGNGDHLDLDLGEILLRKSRSHYQTGHQRNEK